MSLWVKLIHVVTLTVLSPPPDDAALICGCVVTNWLPMHPHWPPGCQASNILWLSGTHLIPDAGNHLRLVNVWNKRHNIANYTDQSLDFFCTESSNTALIILVRTFRIKSQPATTGLDIPCIHNLKTNYFLLTLKSFQKHWLRSCLDSNYLVVSLCITSNMQYNYFLQ